MSGPDDGPERFWADLRLRFRRHRPQGSPTWNFVDAFRRLEAAWGLRPDSGGGGARAVAAPPAAGDAKKIGDAEPVPASRGVLRQGADRLALDRLRHFVDARATAVSLEVTARAVDEATGAQQARLQEGFSATIEALRFLAFRVARLEEVAAVRAEPVPDLPWLAPLDEPGPLAAAVATALAEAGVTGDVLHAECGDGSLLAALAAAGVRARGVDPRLPRGLAAVGAGLDVSVGEAVEALEETSPGGLAALVLSGVVDRVPIDEVLGLVSLALSRLAAGAPLVVVSAGPAAVDGWPAVALDLLPGRPLHLETWELLLGRAGCRPPRIVGDDGAGSARYGGPYAVMAEAPE